MGQASRSARVLQLRHSREITLLCSPKVTHHHGQLGSVLPSGKSRSLAARQMPCGLAVPPPASIRFAGTRSFPCDLSALTRLWRGRWKSTPHAQIRRNATSADKRSSNCRVGLMWYTALAPKARAIARRSLAGRPTPPAQPAINPSMRILLSTATSCRCFSVKGPNSSLQRREQSPLPHPYKLLQLVGESKLHMEGNPSGLELAFEILF